jgi:hypothetical protein
MRRAIATGVLLLALYVLGEQSAQTEETPLTHLLDKIIALRTSLPPLLPSQISETAEYIETHLPTLVLDSYEAEVLLRFQPDIVKIMYLHGVNESLAFSYHLSVQAFDRFKVLTDKQTANKDVSPEEFQLALSDVVKVLAVTSPFAVPVDMNGQPKLFEMLTSVAFQSSPHLWCQWYTSCLSSFKSFVSDKTALENARTFIDPKGFTQYPKRFLAFNELLAYVYSGVSYISGVHDREMKFHINKELQRILPENNVSYSGVLPLWKENEPIRVVILTQFWFQGHSVHRTFERAVKHMLADKSRFEVFFVGLGAFPSLEAYTNIQEYGFSDHIVTTQDSDLEKSQAALQFIASIQPHIALFMDVGMSWPSIFLANIRIAPVMVATQGHSVSTYGSFVDYFITGNLVEPKVFKSWYSENVIVAPGLGIVHNKVSFPKRDSVADDSEALIINLPWSSQKANAPMLSVLNSIAEQVGKDSSSRLLFRFYFGNVSILDTEVLSRNLPKGPTWESSIISLQDYDQYMILMQEGDLNLDSFHYGGCNTIVDALLARVPVVVWEGSKWHNRIGAATLREALHDHSEVLEALIATSKQEYLKKSVDLLVDSALRARIKSQIQSLNLDATIFSTRYDSFLTDSLLHIMKHKPSNKVTLLNSVSSSKDEL